MNDTRKVVVDVYRSSRGKEPFTDWLASIKNKKTRGKIETRMNRVEEGNLGDS